MNRFIAKHCALLLAAILAGAVSGQAVAHGDRDRDRFGERISTIWQIDGISGEFEVAAPAGLRLSIIKKYFIAKSEIPVREARNYVVEQVIETTVTDPLPGRGPNTPPGTVTPPPSTTITTEYVLLDDSLSLSEQGIVAGDTLRIREAEEGEISETGFERNDHRRHRHARYHHSRHHHHGKGKHDRGRRHRD